MTINNEEKIITFLNNKLLSSDTNQVSINKNDIETIGLTEQEIVQILFILQEKKYIEITRKSVHNNFSMSWHITLYDACINYFKNKKSQIKSNKREWVRTYLPITISLISLVKSFSTEILAVLEQILKLIEQLLK